MADELQTEYAKARKAGYLASHAIYKARAAIDFAAAESENLVRLRWVPDESYSLGDLEGDTYNPKANPDIAPSRLARERKEFHALIERDGVWGLVGEYFDGRKWQSGDSVWGLVGQDDCGYLPDIQRATLDALATLARCPTCGGIVHEHVATPWL